MGQRDLEYAYERFKLDRDIIKPYSDEMEMVRRIKGYEAHFFPWTRWLIVVLLSLLFFIPALTWLPLNLITEGRLITGFIADYVAIGIMCLGIPVIIFALFLRRKYMVVSVDGISLPRVFGENHLIQWPSITKIGFETSGFQQTVTLVIEYGSQKVKTNLDWYTNIYLKGKKSTLRFVRVLQACFRLMVLDKDLEPIRRQIKQDLTKRYGLPEAIGGLVFGLWALVARGLVFFAGWLILIPALVMALPLSVVAISITGLRQGRPLTKKIRNWLIVNSLIIAICVIIIILMLLPLVP